MTVPERPSRGSVCARKRGGLASSPHDQYPSAVPLSDTVLSLLQAAPCVTEARMPPSLAADDALRETELSLRSLTGADLDLLGLRLAIELRLQRVDKRSLFEGGSDQRALGRGLGRRGAIHGQRGIGREGNHDGGRSEADLLLLGHHLRDFGSHGGAGGDNDAAVA